MAGRVSKKRCCETCPAVRFVAKNGTARAVFCTPPGPGSERARRRLRNSQFIGRAARRGSGASYQRRGRLTAPLIRAADVASCASLESASAGQRQRGQDANFGSMGRAHGGRKLSWSVKPAGIAPFVANLMRAMTRFLARQWQRRRNL